MGAAGGIWAGPIGMGIGILVGGVLGALLSDHAYVEAVGSSDPMTRQFVDRFTSFWMGTDESELARALATEHRANPGFVRRVLSSLNDAYHTDADDVALELVKIARRDPALTEVLRQNRDLREVMIHRLAPISPQLILCYLAERVLGLPKSY